MALLPFEKALCFGPLQKDVPCYAFIYTPAGDPLVESVVRSMQAANQPLIPASQIMGLADANQVRC